MYPAQGIAALAAVLLGAGAGTLRPQLVASPFDWPKLMAGATHIFPLFSEHALPGSSSKAATPVAAGSTAVDRLARRGRASAAHQPAASTGEALRRVAAVVAGVLGKQVDPGEPLMEAGLDSLGAVELQIALGSEFGSELPATVTFDYPSVTALAGFLAGETHPRGCSGYVLVSKISALGRPAAVNCCRYHRDLASDWVLVVDKF